MTLEENKALVRRHFEEILNQRNIALVDELFSLDYTHHHPKRDKLPPGHAGVKQFLAMAMSAFSDNHITIDDMIAEGDKVVVRASSKGKHTGEFMGIPPTEKVVQKRSIDIFRVVDGKLVEHWDIMNDLEIRQQLGIIPPLGTLTE